MARRKPRFALDINALASGGDGLGRDDNGRVTFVPQTAIGDRCLVELVDVRKEFARGRSVKLLEPSPDRQEPGCEHFATGNCGGCQWRHLQPQAHRRAKEDVVAQALRRSIAAGAVVHPLFEPCQPDSWRRRVRLAYWAQKARVLGFFPARSHRVSDIASCPQLTEPLDAMLATLRAELLPHLRGRGEVSLLQAENAQILVAVVGGAQRQALEALAGRPEVAGVLHVNAPGQRATDSWGASEVEIEAGVWSSALEFAQASRDGNLALRKRVGDSLGPLAGKRVLELYAGRGNFTSLLGDADEVVAVEVVAAARRAGGAQVDWRTGDAGEVCDALVADAQRFDIVLLDPPRSGAKEAVDAIAALRPAKILYVSCNPATLARDATRLSELGYRPAEILPLDLMPQTAHVEVLMRFEAVND